VDDCEITREKLMSTDEVKRLGRACPGLRMACPVVVVLTTKNQL
jgi:hypothetical protein